MKNVKLTSEDLKALDVFLNTNPCNNGCAYSEMRNSKKDCSECSLTKTKNALLEKLGLSENN